VVSVFVCMYVAEVMLGPLVAIVLVPIFVNIYLVQATEKQWLVRKNLLAEGKKHTV